MKYFLGDAKLNQNPNPTLWVVENFYEDPIAIRNFALSLDYHFSDYHRGRRTEHQYEVTGTKEKFESIKDIRADYPDIVFVYDGEFLFEGRIETQRDNPYQSKSFFILNFYSDVVGEFYDTLTFSEIFEDVKKLL